MTNDNKYPHFIKCGESIVNPHYIIYVNCNEDKIYGFQDLNFKIDHTNELFHYIMMKNLSIDLDDAMVECYKRLPYLIIYNTQVKLKRVIRYFAFH